MMKKLLVLACALVIGTAAYAAPAKASAKAPVAHMSGTIGKYDPGTKQLTVKHDGKETVFAVGDSSQVMKGKTKADASALGASSGQEVKVAYVMSGATRVAEKLEVADHAAAKPKK